MGRFSPSGSTDSFWFPKELGERLRTVRQERQMTQEQVAVMMGRNGRGNKTIVSRLELGRFSSPSLRVVLDYLRACRAGLDEVREILERYLSRPRVPERIGAERVKRLVKYLPKHEQRQVVDYDAGMTSRRREARRKPETGDARVARAAAAATDALLQHRLRKGVQGFLSQRYPKLPWMGRKFLQDHARKVWGILKRTRHDPARRQKLLAGAGAWLAEGSGVSPEQAEAVAQEVRDSFGAAEARGELDWRPTEPNG